MGTSRTYYRYHFKLGNKIVHTGITNDIDIREYEHRRKEGWERGHIVQVGHRTTPDAALQWEDEQRENGKPTGPRTVPPEMYAPKTAMIDARVELELKQEAEKVFTTLGLSPSDAIALFYKQTALHHGLPFESKIPNDEALEAVHQARTEEGLGVSSSVEERRADLLKLTDA